MPGILTLRPLGPAAAAANVSAQRNGSVGVSRTDKVRDENRAGQGTGGGVAPSFASTRGPRASPALHSTSVAPGAPPAAGTGAAAPYRSNLHRQLLQHQMQQQQTDGHVENPLNGFTTAAAAAKRGNGLDIFKRLGGFDYSSSGSEHDPNSVCLAEMVCDYIEEDLDVSNCGRARCNCANNCSSPEGTVRSEGSDSKSSVGGGIADVLLELTESVSPVEKSVLASVMSALKSVDEREGLGEASRCSTSVKRSVMTILRAAGHNAAICKSRWDNVGGFPGGVYEYIDIIPGGQIDIGKSERLLVDIDFLSQFKIARPTAHYSMLLETLPAVFVGRADRLQQIVNIMCDAAKRSLKKSGMHLPPWRKPEYIRGRWFSAYRRTTNEVTISDELNVGQTDLRKSRWSSKFAEEMEKTYMKAPDPRISAWRIRNIEDDVQGLHPAGRKCDYEPEGQVRGGKILVGVLDLKKQNAGIGNLYSTGGACELMSSNIAPMTPWVPPAVKPRTAAQRAATGKVGGLVTAMKECEEDDLLQSHLPDVMPKACEQTGMIGGLSKQISLLVV